MCTAALEHVHACAHHALVIVCACSFAQHAYAYVHSTRSSISHLKVAVMLHPRTVDPHNFVNVLNSLNSEADRQAVLDMCTSVKSVKARK